MATVRPFRGFRYAPERVDISLVLAPAGDVDDAAREALYDREPRNAIRVVAHEAGPGAPEDAAARRAALHLAEWRRAGIVVEDEHPSLYLLRQTTRTEEGEERSLTGFFGALRLDAAARRDVKELSQPEDEDESTDSTDAEAVDAQRRHLVTVGMHTDPLLLLYQDDGGRIERAFRVEMEEREADVRARAFDAQYEIWIIDDETTTARVARQLEEHPLYLADGRRRLQAALEVEQERARARPARGVDEEPVSVIAFFVSADEDVLSSAEARANVAHGSFVPKPPRGVVFSPLVALGDDDG